MSEWKIATHRSTRVYEGDTAIASFIDGAVASKAVLEHNDLLLAKQRLDQAQKMLVAVRSDKRRVTDQLHSLERERDELRRQQENNQRRIMDLIEANTQLMKQKQELQESAKKPLKTTDGPSLMQSLRVTNEILQDRVNELEKTAQTPHEQRTTRVDYVSDETLRQLVQERFDMRYKAEPVVEAPADADLLRRLKFANRARGQQGEMIHTQRLEIGALREKLAKPPLTEWVTINNVSLANTDPGAYAAPGRQDLARFLAQGLDNIPFQLQRLADVVGLQAKAMEESNRIREEELT